MAKSMITVQNSANPKCNIYDDDFKQEALRRVFNGESAYHVAKSMRCSYASICAWKKNYKPSVEHASSEVVQVDAEAEAKKLNPHGFRYEPAFKRLATARVKYGESITVVARSMGVSVNQLGRWLKKEKEAKHKEQENANADATTSYARLQEENAYLHKKISKLCKAITMIVSADF